MISPVNGIAAKKRRALSGALPGQSLRLEDEPDAHAGAKRLLEEVAVHASRRERKFEVLIDYTKALIGVLVDERFGLSVEDVKGIEAQLQTHTLIEFPGILEVCVDARCRWCTAEIAATKQGYLTGILIRLLGD